MRSLKNVFMRSTERLLSHLLMENQAVYLCFVLFLPTSVDVYKKNHSKYIFCFYFFSVWNRVCHYLCSKPVSRLPPHPSVFVAVAIKRKRISKSPAAVWRKLDYRSMKFTNLHKKCIMEICLTVNEPCYDKRMLTKTKLNQTLLSVTVLSTAFSTALE